MDIQLAQCGNITCTSKQPMPFTPATRAECLAAASDQSTLAPPIFPELSATGGAEGAGANGQLYNGMVLPFVNMSLKGWIWCKYSQCYAASIPVVNQDLQPRSLISLIVLSA